MLKSPFKSPTVRALGVTVTTFAVLGGASVVVTSGVTTVVRFGLKLQRKRHAAACPVCLRKGTKNCQICKGQNVLDWSPFKDPQVKRLCVCPACQGTGQQRCLNCSGEGVVQGVVART